MHAKFYKIGPLGLIVCVEAFGFHGKITNPD